MAASFELRVLAIVFAVALQFQVTLPIGPVGVRTAASDLFMPIGLFYVIMWVLFSHAWRKSYFRWRMPRVLFWLAGLTAVMLIALFVGRWELGHWSSWALLNKFVGWLLLVAYFLMGSVFVWSGGLDVRAAFLTVFLITAGVVAAVNAIALPIIFPYYTLPFGIEFSRATGGMQNPNAFGFLMAVAAMLALTLREKSLWLLPACLTALWFSASRGALLAWLAGTVTVMVIAHRSWIKVLRSSGIALGAVLAVTAAVFMVTHITEAQVTSGGVPVGFLSGERIQVESGTIAAREQQNAQAVSLFAAKPLFGYGLGYFLEKTGFTLHNSVLWLALETGLIGALAFSGFLVSAVVFLYLGRADPFLLGMVGVSVAFAAMSVSGEFLYQRHLWMLLGMALARPPVQRAGA